MYSRTAATFLALSSLAFANPIERPTRVNLAKRAPSPYPYGDALTNEFQWENWDPDNDDDKADGQKIHEGFKQWADLVKAGLAAANGGTSNDHFKRWFGNPDADDITAIQNTFKNMYDDAAGTAATAISKMVLDRKDFGDNCDTKGWYAYTTPDTGRFHICPKTIDLKQQDETTCADFDQAEYIYYPSARTVSFVMLHEMTHFDDVADDRLGAIGDPAVGPRACFNLDDEDKQINANNYAFEAAEQYWADKCPTKTFKDPPPLVSSTSTSTAVSDPSESQVIDGSGGNSSTPLPSETLVPSDTPVSSATPIATA